jgi:N4-gp56 family major capsid protein
MTSTGSITSASNLHKFVENTAIKQFKKNTVFYGMGEKRTLKTGDHQYQFNIVTRNTFDATAATLVEGTTPTEVQFAFTSVVFDMTQYGVNALLTDLVVKDSPIDVYTYAAEELGRQLGQIVDSLVQVQLASTTNGTQTQVLYSGTGNAATIDVAAGDIATASQFATAAAILESKAAPKYDGSYVAVVHPLVMKDLLTESGN